MLQVLLILLETRTIVLFYLLIRIQILVPTVILPKNCTSLIQMESTSAYVCTHMVILILVHALVSAPLFVVD